MSESEHVNHPAHYGGDTVYETIKVLEAWQARERFIGFLEGNVIKYLSRAGKKSGGIEDYEKALWYQEKLVEFLKRVPAEPMNSEIQKTLGRVLSNILSAVVKREDAPCSANTHMNMAICYLLELLPDWTTDNEQFMTIIGDAGFELGIYKKIAKKGGK